MAFGLGCPSPPGSCGGSFVVAAGDCCCCRCYYYELLPVLMFLLSSLCCCMLIQNEECWAKGKPESWTDVVAQLSWCNLACRTDVVAQSFLMVMLLSWCLIELALILMSLPSCVDQSSATMQNSRRLCRVVIWCHFMVSLYLRCVVPTPILPPQGMMTTLDGRWGAAGSRGSASQAGTSWWHTRWCCLTEGHSIWGSINTIFKAFWSPQNGLD